MFRFSKAAFRKSPQFKRAFAISGATAAGIAVTTTAVAFAAPQKVTDKEIATPVPALTPRDLSEPTSYETARAEAAAADRDTASAQGSGEGRQAYNPETGEIDWDCPCLGGMAHGPCGEEFKAAFSCFVYSKEEIRGSECIPKFSAMQDCFRKYPEVYSEFNDDTETVAESDRAKAATAGSEIAQYPAEAKDKATETKDRVADKAAEAKDKAIDVKDRVADRAADARNKVADAKDQLATKASDAKDQVADRTVSAKDQLADRVASAKDQAANRASDASAHVQQATEQSRQKAEDILSNARDSAKDIRDDVASHTQVAERKVSNAVGDHPVKDTEQSIESAAQGAGASLNDAAATASEVAAQKTAEYRSLLTEAGEDLTDVLSQYATKAQDAANQLIEEAKQSTQGLTREQISKAIEEKLVSAHEAAHEAFGNTEKNQSVLRQSQKFATDAIAGIAAEAKEAVNYVSEQVGKK